MFKHKELIHSKFNLFARKLRIIDGPMYKATVPRLLKQLIPAAHDLQRSQEALLYEYMSKVANIRNNTYSLIHQHWVRRRCQ